MGKTVRVGIVILLLLCIIFLASCNEIGEEYSSISLQHEWYILNTNSKKIHKNTCGTAFRIKEQNREEYVGDISDLYIEGYTVCGNCFR